MKRLLVIIQSRRRFMIFLSFCGVKSILVRPLNASSFAKNIRGVPKASKRQ